MKDHPTFLHAAALLVQDHPKARFVCVGSGPESYQRELRAIATHLKLDEHLIWAGTSNNMQAVYSALQIATSASAYGEGFANMIGEAMACGVPCVVTDVGDSAQIVADTGCVVPALSPAALTNAWQSLITLGMDARERVGQRARERIIDNFSTSTLITRHQLLYERILANSILTKR
jgi:glycosyltransferase involved in cell wall biosynthesis